MLFIMICMHQTMECHKSSSFPPFLSLSHAHTHHACLSFPPTLYTCTRLPGVSEALRVAVLLLPGGEGVDV